MTNTSSPKASRSSRLPPHVIARIAKSTQAGQTRPEVAALVGISLGTLQRWITIGRRPRPPEASPRMIAAWSRWRCAWSSCSK
ncbi:hypothetical protein [Streptomyces peucetius]|uniref:Helix-turn-helix domain-containing protein n=1 Tax=Streptomyces peucetius TaxID=1950 RepID=A0ABY6HZ97_STRPE|nr:hypothetical protein [Streptomyces peucetius]UYQ60033.1 hypothetical protein OGH68_00035 [Streptomyces peucetius]